MATISDVARHAGVSIKSVSRVLNGEPHVRPALRDKVIRSVAALDYRPNLAARQLAGNRSFLIAYLYFNAPVTYVTSILSAASNRCRQLGYHLISEAVDHDEDAAGLVNSMVSRLRPDGILLSPPLSDWPMLLAAIAASGIPVVRIAGSEPGPGEVVAVDHRPVSVEMTRHLIELGHRRIGFIGATRDFRAAQGRLAGFREAHEQAGIEADEELIVSGNFSFISGYHAGSLLLSHKRPPTAIFAANDAMAAGVMAAARQAGLRLPEDLAVAGFDDSPISRMTWPPLTTVRQPIADYVSLAIERLTGREGRNHFEPDHELVIRGSTSGDCHVVESAIDM